MQEVFDQSDRSLYSFLVDALVGFLFHFNDLKRAEEYLAPRKFASEPNGGILTESWLVVTKTLRESNIETLQTKAQTLKKSEKLVESIAGHTVLWALANYEYTKRHKKTSKVVDDSAIDDLLKDCNCRLCDKCCL